MRPVKRHWPFALLAALALVLLLTNLGSDYLWADEGDTAVLASNILKFDVPKAWDGVTFIDADFGARENSRLVMVSHPWVQYYVAAASFYVLGENTFAARLPFALAGWLTIVLVYLFVWQITAHRWTAFSASALTVLSVQFLLYSRQCRNYSLHMLFTLWLFWIFFRMKSLRSCVLFILVAVLLFHTHPLGIVPVGVLGILTLIYRPLAPQRRWFWLAFPVVVIFTVPWLILARTGLAENVVFASSAGDFLERLGHYLLDCASVTPILGVLILLGISLVRRMGFLSQEEATLVIITFATLLGYVLAIAESETSGFLWLIGIRHSAALIPLLAMIAAILITKISRCRLAIALPLLLVFGFTRLADLTPWLFWAGQISPSHKGALTTTAHVPNRLVDALLRPEQILFVRDLWHDNPGAVGKACKFLQPLIKPGDRLIVNYSSEPFYFYTHLPQALKIFPYYPGYAIARQNGLPDYVFSIDHVHWIVWSLFWDKFNPYRWNDLERDIVAQGGRITQVAELNETIWENCENVRFRRYSGGRYVFPFAWQNLPPTGIFRVDWPDKVSAAP